MNLALAENNEVVRKARILIVEDSVDFCSLLQRLLEDNGYLVEHAYDGQKALDLLNSSSDLPDLIMLDLMMPVLDGFEFRKIQEADARLAKIPVIVMSAHGDVEVSKHRIGIVGFLRKPMTIEKILSMVEHAIKN